VTGVVLIFDLSLAFIAVSLPHRISRGAFARQLGTLAALLGAPAVNYHYEIEVNSSVRDRFWSNRRRQAVLC